MALFNRVGNVLRSNISASVQSPTLTAVRFMSNKLYVGGLSSETGSQALKEVFSSFGDVVDVKVITDRETGRSRGFGFVNFESEEAAMSAKTAMNGQNLDGRNIIVDMANERPPRNNFGGGYGGGNGGGYGGSGYGSGNGVGYGGSGYGGGNNGGYGGGNGGGYGSGNGGGYGGGNNGGYGGSGYGSGNGGGYGGSGYGGGNNGGYDGGNGGGYGNGNSSFGGGGNGGGNGGNGYGGGRYGGGNSGGFGGAAASNDY